MLAAIPVVTMAAVVIDVIPPAISERETPMAVVTLFGNTEIVISGANLNRKQHIKTIPKHEIAPAATPIKITAVFLRRI